MAQRKLRSTRMKEVPADADWPEPTRSELIAEEQEREFRDKRPAKFCPACGRKPEIPLLNGGRHVYTGHCEKCQIRFVIHVC